MQAVVFGWLHQPSATRKQLHQALLQTGVTMSAQGLDGRFNERAVVFLRAMVEQAGETVLEALVEEPVLKRFKGIYLSDSTRLENTDAPLKVATRLELQRGGVSWSLEGIDTHDNATGVMTQPLPPGALHIGDLAFFDLKRFAQWQQAGVDYVTRYKGGVLLFDREGRHLSILDLLPSQRQQVHVPVLVGAAQIPLWLVARRVSPAVYRQRLQRLKQRESRKQRTVSRGQKTLARWTIYLTSVPDLSFEQVHTLYRARWQIERLFKRWKSLGKLETSTSSDPLRRTCERYAKLLAGLVAHWFSLALCWHDPAASRDSAFSICQRAAPFLYLACFRFPSLLPLLQTVLAALLPSLALTQRKKAPNACDLWALFDGSA